LGKNYVANEQKKAAAYVPPSMRNRSGGPVGYLPVAPIAGASIHIHAQASSSPGGSYPGGSYPGGSYGSYGSYDDKKNANKPRKKKPLGAGEDGHHANTPGGPAKGQGRRNSNKGPENGRPVGDGSAEKKTTDKTPHKSKSEGARPVSPDQASENENEVNTHSSGDPDRDKKILRLNKKLAEITALQKEQAAGKVLEKNQLEKIKRLNSVVSDLEKLQLSAILKKK